MTLDEFNRFCASLPATSHAERWGGTQLWKIGGPEDGKVFAIGGWNKDSTVPGITFKVTPLSYEILAEQPGLRPAPYLASRGMKWIQRHDLPGLSDDDLKAYLQESHRLVAAGLSRRKRQALGLEPAT